MTNKFFKNTVTVFFLSFCITVGLAQASEKTEDKKCDIIIKDKKFTSGNLIASNGDNCQFDLPSAIAHKIKICNEDNVAVEFESHDLHREKVIKPGKSITTSIGPLEKDKIYKFVEEFYGAKCQFKGI